MGHPTVGTVLISRIICLKMRKNLNATQPAESICAHPQQRAVSVHDSEGRIESFLNFSSFYWTVQSEVGHENTIQTPSDAGMQFETDQELRRAFNVLHNALIRTRGGGRFADSSAGIILALETDGPVALAALKQAGIRALAS